MKMSEKLLRFLQEHNRLSRRFFVQAGFASAAAMSVLPASARREVTARNFVRLLQSLNAG